MPTNATPHFPCSLTKLIKRRLLLPATMAAAKAGPPYSPLPAELNYVILPVYYSPSAFFYNRYSYRTACAISILALVASAYVFWPSDPELKIVRLRFNRIHIRTMPLIAIDISMSLTVKVRNSDAYGMDYRELDVAVGYRRKRLGYARSEHGHVSPWGSSYVESELELNGVEILFDMVYLLEDLVNGSVPFDTVTEIKGKLGLFFFEVPLKARVSCQIMVNTTNQTIVRHDCFMVSHFIPYTKVLNLEFRTTLQFSDKCVLSVIQSADSNRAQGVTKSYKLRCNGELQVEGYVHSPASYKYIQRGLNMYKWNI